MKQSAQALGSRGRRTCYMSVDSSCRHGAARPATDPCRSATTTLTSAEQRRPSEGRGVARLRSLAACWHGTDRTPWPWGVAHVSHAIASEYVHTGGRMSRTAPARGRHSSRWRTVQMVATSAPGSAGQAAAPWRTAPARLFENCHIVICQLVQPRSTEVADCSANSLVV